MNELERRIWDISYKYKLSHISSNLTSVNILDHIFRKKRESDIFVLSCGHCAIAYYTILEKYHEFDAESLYKEMGCHPKYRPGLEVHCSTGSLGMGITTAVGYALANPLKDIYVLISDGECSEGSVWESLKYIHEARLYNIHVYVNMNGYSAYNKVDVSYLEKCLKIFLPSINIFYTQTNVECLRGINGHYHILSEEDYEKEIR